MILRVRSAVIIAAVVLLDRITKIYIRTHVSPWDIFPVIPGFFNIVHTENPGAAFGEFADADAHSRRYPVVGFSLGVMMIIGTL